MSRIKELRASVDKVLDGLEHRALALEAQLTQSRAQAIERLEQRKQQLQGVLTQLQGEVQKSKDLAERSKADIQTKIDHLQVQLALGKAEARDALEAQRTKILGALGELEAVADEKLKGATLESWKIWEDLVSRASSLEAELDAIRSRVQVEKARQEEALGKKKEEVLTKLQAYQRDLKSKREQARAKGETFVDDLRKGLDQIQAAFQKLFE